MAHWQMTASADVFVKGAAPSLHIPAPRIHGIEVRIREGRLTDELVYPLTRAEGKRLMRLVKEISKKNPGEAPEE